MKTLQQHINEKLVLNNNTKIGGKTVPEYKSELKQLIKETLENDGPDTDLNFIDVSKIDDMSFLFDRLNPGKIDVSSWDVSNVEMMQGMFAHCENFDADLTGWDVSKVKTFRWMFEDCKKFKGVGLKDWNVKNADSLGRMFSGCEEFNEDISGWDISDAKNISSMFAQCKSFNQDLSNWKLSPKSAVNVNNMFDGCPIKDEFKPNFIK
jgi:surface protein